MGFVHHQQGVGRKVIKQSRRRLPGPAPGQVAGVVLDAIAVTQLQHHLDVIPGALFQTLSFHQPVVIPQLLQALIQLHLDVLYRIQHRLARGDVVGLRIDRHPGHPAQNLAGERIEIAEVLHLIIEQFDPYGFLLRFRREHVDDIAPNPVIGPMKLDVIAGVLKLGQPTQDKALVNLIAPIEVQHHLQVGLGITQTVNGRYRGHNDRVRPFQQRFGGRQPHLLDVLVDGGIFLDEGVGRRHVGFRLVIIVVGDEVLHRVIRKELTELAIQLGRQGLVVGHDDGRPLHLLDDIGNGEGFP